MRKIYGLLTVFFLFVVSAAHAQEICDNGIDDDGDGYVDCYDGSCAGSTSCDGFFLGEESDCQAYPTEFPEFKMKLMWASEDQTTSSYGRVSVGDLNSDGIPEVVAANQLTNKVNILNGKNGQTIETISLDFSPTDEVTLADIDRDGYVEIFVPSINGSKAIQAFRYNVSSGKYESLWKKSTHSSAFSILGVADFKETGKAQLYLFNEIWDAETGTVLVQGTGNWADEIPMAPVAVDILDDSECGNCAGLELVSGGTIYAVNLGNGTAGNGSLTAVKTMSETGTTYYPKSSVWNRNYSSTSVADYDSDGYLDVIATGATGKASGKTTVFYWNVKNGTTLTYSDPKNNWQNGTGRLNIADLDGNGALNVSYVSGSYLYALDESFNLLWRKSIKEGTSGFTGCTVFDFNGDGAYETVYRSEEYLFIINGTDGSDYRTIPCVSRTAVEYPVVADIDGDGATEICVACNTDNNTDIYKDWRLAQYSQVRAFESDGENWVPSRRVWNQHAYFNVNINDNMSVPIEVQKHNIGFTGGRCDDGTIRRPLNTFLNQSPFLDINGCPIYGAADFNIVENSFKVTQPTCPETDFTVSFSVRNDGDVAVNGSVPFSFYNGDPFKDTSLWLGTQTVEVTNMKPGEVINITGITVTGPGSAFQLYLSFNDEGMTPPIKLPNGGILECSTEENIANVAVIPGPFPVEVEVVKDHETCGPDAKGNGVLKAFVLQGTTQVTEGFEFNWYEGNDDTGKHLGTGAVLSNQKDGTYTVVATHVAAGCYSSANQGVIGTTTPTLAISLNTISNLTSCAAPNGSQEVSGITRNGEADELDNYTFEWYKTSDPAKIITIGTSMNTMEAGVSYTVRATDKLSACTATASGGNLTDETTSYSLLVGTATPITCANLQGSASVTTPGSTGLQIRWYNGYAINDAQEITSLRGNASATGLSAGNYSVIAVNTATGCTSNQGTFTIEDIRSDITISGTPVSNDACDASVASGGVNISSPNSLGLTFTWYAGNGTSGTEISGAQVAANGSLQNVMDGEYTLVVNNTSNACSETAYFTVGNEQKSTKIGTANFTTTPNTVCTPTASLPNNGRIEISSLKVGGNTITDLSGYTFRWYTGNTASGTPIADESSSVLDQLAAGTYTVVAENTGSKCTSNTQTIQVKDATAAPEFKLTASPQESCDSSNPNGSIEATMTDGSAIDASAYKIEWYVGNGTTTALAASKVTGFKAINLAGNSRYTAVLTNLATNCSTTKTILVTENKVIPTVSLAIDKAISCSQEGRLLADVTNDDASEYTFSWTLNGTTISGAHSPALETVSGNPLPSGDYTVTASHTQNTCTSITQSIRLESPAPAFTIDVTEVLAASECDGTSATGDQGTLSAAVGGTTTGYTFTWYEGAPSNLPADFYSSPEIALGAQVGSGSTVNLYQGIYTVVAEDASGCKNYVVTQMRAVSSPNIISASPVEITTCDPDTNPAKAGEIAVTLESGSNYAEYDYYLISGSNVTDFTSIQNQQIDQILGSNYNASYTGPVTFTGIVNPGAYTVAVVTNNTAEACWDTRTVEVDQIAQPPLFTRLDVSADTDCISGSGLGTLTVEVSPGHGDTESKTFTYVLVRTSDNVEVERSSATTSLTYPFANVDAGEYRVDVLAEETNCSASETVTIDQQAFTGEIIIATETDNTNCTPDNGTIILSDTEAALDIASDYLFDWYTRSAFDAGEAAYLQGTKAYQQTGLAAGDYVIVATVNRSGVAGNGCELSPVFVQLGDDRSLPTLSLTATNRTFCNTPDGSIQAVVSNPGYEPTSYTFEWFMLDAAGNETAPSGTLTAISGSEEELAGLNAGQYRVRATNPVNGCFIEQDISLYDNRQYPTLSLRATDQPDCNYGGSLEVTGLNPDVLADYTFSWYRGDANSSPVYVGGPLLNVSTYPNIEADVYYVVAEHNTTSCKNAAMMARINRTASDPEISLIEAVANTSCDLPNGSLKAEAFGGSGLYSFSWYQNGIELTGETNATLSGYGAGSYRVVARDNATNCTREATYQIVDDPYVPQIATSTVPLSVCADGVDYLNNGTALATIANPHASIGYEFHWYSGSLSTYPGASAVGTNGMLAVTANGEALENLPAGDYTVFAIETTASRNCPVVSSQLQIEDITTSPVAQVEELAAMTNCDISRPNGQLSASVNGSSTNYRFEWFLDSTGESLGQGTTLSKLNAGVDYRLVVTNLLSGCQSSSVHQVSEKTVYPVLDPAEVVAVPQTNCQVGNGSLSASVNGNTASYDFLWFRINDQNKPVAINGHTGPVLSGLEAGNYQLQVRNRNSGCLSELVNATIALELSYPEVEVSILPGTCNGIKDGQATLSGKNVLRNEWFDGSGRLIATNTITLELPVGIGYSVVAYNQYDCPTTYTFDVGTEITPYNAVTPNSDGYNDFFIIECIEEFPNNEVKVYNRAGTLVYAIDGYNNLDKAFSGVGNKGVYPMQNKLPDGTYYYVVDKKAEGEKPVSGFLELKR